MDNIRPRSVHAIYACRPPRHPVSNNRLRSPTWSANTAADRRDGRDGWMQFMQ